MEQHAIFAGSIPANYDKYLAPFLFEPYAKEMASRLQDKKYNNILEIACGTGRVTAHLAKSVLHDNLTATDLNKDMIAVAKEKIPGKKIIWLEANAMELPFDKNSFDAVVCQFALMFFPDKLKGLKEAYKVLKSGGKLLFSTWDKLENVPAMFTGRKMIESFFENDPPDFYKVPYSMHDENELQSLMKDAGFRNIKVSRIIKEGISETAADLVKGMVEGNPIYVAICEKDPSLIKPIKEKVEKILSEKFGNKPLKSQLSAWICEAEK